MDTVIDNGHIYQWTKRFGLNWSISDSFLSFRGFDPSKNEVKWGFDPFVTLV